MIFCTKDDIAIFEDPGTPLGLLSAITIVAPSEYYCQDCKPGVLSYESPEVVLDLETSTVRWS